MSSVMYASLHGYSYPSYARRMGRMGGCNLQIKHFEFYLSPMLSGERLQYCIMVESRCLAASFVGEYMHQTMVCIGCLDICS